MSLDVSSTSAVRPVQTEAVARPTVADSEVSAKPHAPGYAPETAAPAARIDPHQQRKELEQAIQRLNEQIQRTSYNLTFSVDDASNHVVVKVMSADNGEVIRQIPNETVLRIAKNLEEIKGLLQDQKI